MPIIEYDSYKQKLGALEPRLDKLAAALDLEGARREVEELEEYPRAELLRFTDRNLPVRPLWPCTFWQRLRSGVARLPSWMQSTPWIPFMPLHWV